MQEADLWELSCAPGVCVPKHWLLYCSQSCSMDLVSLWFYHNHSLVSTRTHKPHTHTQSILQQICYVTLGAAV